MIDLQVTDDFELIVGPNGDLALCYGDQYIIQQILFRVKTTQGDYLLDPSVGASLEEFIGQPNESLTWSAITQRVESAITQDGLLPFAEVGTAAVSQNEVVVLIQFTSQETDDRIISVISELDLRKGLVSSRVDTQNS